MLLIPLPTAALRHCRLRSGRRGERERRRQVYCVDHNGYLVSLLPLQPPLLLSRPKRPRRRMRPPPLLELATSLLSSCGAALTTPRPSAPSVSLSVDGVEERGEGGRKGIFATVAFAAGHLVFLAAVEKRGERQDRGGGGLPPRPGPVPPLPPPTQPAPPLLRYLPPLLLRVLSLLQRLPPRFPSAWTYNCQTFTAKLEGSWSRRLQETASSW